MMHSHMHALTHAFKHTTTHTVEYNQYLFCTNIWFFLHWFDGIRNNNHLEWKGEMHFFEWLRQIFVLVLMSKRIINLKFPLLWMNWCLLKLFICIMIYEKVTISKLFATIYLSLSEMMIIYNLSLWYFALCDSLLTTLYIRHK